jgi:dTDP-4-amino-4,6-dideoxygalactose transaminase
VSRIFLSPPDVGPDERALLLDAFDSGWIAPVGSHIDAFEREVATWAGVPHAAALSSGTAALHLALLLLGVGPGDEVIVPTLTFVATANVVTYVGATPRFIDSDAASWCIDPALLAEELDVRARAGRLPKAVITVDLYGQCCDYDAIEATCAAHGVTLIEDAAEALGATCGGRPAGSFGTAAAFSFNGNKIITTSGGGMLVSSDAGLVERARHLATQARDPEPHYEHSVVGYNYRLSNLLAALGRGQLRGLDAKIARRRAINERYREALGAIDGVGFLPIAAYGQPNHWLTVIALDPSRTRTTPAAVGAHLAALDIEARPAWKPMHLQPLYREAPMRGGAVAEQIFATGLCLPSGSNLADAEQDVVIDAVVAAIGRARGDAFDAP